MTTPSAPRRAAVGAARQAERAASVTARQAGRVRPGDAPIVPILLIGVGGYLLWYAVHYFAQTKANGSTLWPSDPVKAVLTGKPMPATVHTPTAGQYIAGEISAANAGQQAADTAAAGGPASPASPVGAAGLAGAAVSGVYDHSALMALWRANGGDPGKANLAAAIAQAESSGRASVTSGNPDGGTNVGLWQLDTKGKGAGYSVARLQDPNLNARLTVFGSQNGTDWSAWATYASGAYRQFMTGG